MFRIRGVVQTYAWGNHTGIQEVLGLEPDGTPAAEYWLGAHPKAPSTTPDSNLDGCSTLDTYIAQHPEVLGDSVRSRFGDRLPFLLKLLSARTALSIQAHPSAEQAREGFERENAAGMELDAPERNYRDAFHKPEMIVALTPFDALCGFREVGAIRATFERMVATTSAIHTEVITDVVRLLDGPDPLRATVAKVLGDPVFAQVADAVAANPPGRVEVGDVSRVGSVCDPIDTLVRVNADFPGDAGALVAVMLNMVTLGPGEAMALDAGVLHAYLGGFGVEIMASSDNVLRGGLTSKHIDVPELTRVVRYEPTAAHVREAAAGQWLRGATEDFTLMRLGEAARVEVGLAGPAIVLCVDGRYTLAAGDAGGTGGDVGGTVAEVAMGDAVFVPATAGSVTVDGRGQLFIASV